MKIVTWNCNGALRNKFEFLLDYDADIYVIQECEDPSKTKHIDYKEWASNYFWSGNDKNKGLGVFAKNNVILELLNWSNKYQEKEVKHFLPCIINNDFQLIAVWTHYNDSPNFQYIGQLWKYLQINKINFTKSLLIGDFNSNSIWDVWDRWWNHSDVVGELEECGIKSLYHKYFNEEQGNENKPTFYLHRKLEKAYHIDYAFGSESFINHLNTVEIGNYEKWLMKSDHIPILFEFKE